MDAAQMLIRDNNDATRLFRNY